MKKKRIRKVKIEAAFLLEDGAEIEFVNKVKELISNNNNIVIITEKLDEYFAIRNAGFHIVLNPYNECDLTIYKNDDRIAKLYWWLV